MSLTTVSALFRCVNLCLDLVGLLHQLCIYVALHLFSVPSRISPVDCTWLMLLALNLGCYEEIWPFTKMNITTLVQHTPPPTSQWPQQSMKHTKNARMSAGCLHAFVMPRLMW